MFLSSFSGTINRWCQYISGVIAALLMIMSTVDVVGRHFFNRPLPGTAELTGLGMVPLVFLALGACQHYGEHITMDVVFTRLPKKAQPVVRAVAELLSLILVAVICWQFWGYAARMAAGGYSTGVLRLPLWPWVYVALVGFALYALALLNDFVAAVREIRRA